MPSTLVCFLCGGTQIYQGPRFTNHLIHSHGVMINLEYIIKVSQYKGTNSWLPPISLQNSLPSKSQPSQTDILFSNKCTKFLEPVDTFLKLTPGRETSLNNSQLSSQLSRQLIFTQAKSFSMKSEISLQRPGIGSDDLPVRFGFRCVCALCRGV